MLTKNRGRACARPRLAIVVSVLALATAQAAYAQPSSPPVGPILSLQDALAQASAADPGLTSWASRLEAADASVRQAQVRPNPTLGVEIENFAGTGPISLFDRSETTLSYQQMLERGGKREARVTVARASFEVARRRQEVRRLDFLRDVQIAYVEAHAAEATLLVAEARLIAAQSAQRDVARRVQAARDPLFAGSRAQATTAQAEIDRDQAEQAARDARAVLARYWGGASNFTLALEPFFDAAPPSVAAGPLATADLSLLEAERDLAAANVRTEQARAVQDPTLQAGLRHFALGNDLALVVGGSIPLRVNDTNKAGIARAIAERNAAETDIAAERLVREREVARLTARLSAAATESERLRTEVIPNALKAVEQVRDGFNRGGFQYINVADAEKALADVRARRVAVLRQYHLDQAALDRLTGRFGALASSNLNSERR